MNCDYYPLPSLSAWVEVDKMSDELTEELLMDAISKAESKVLNRQKMEYDSWKKRKSNMQLNSNLNTLARRNFEVDLKSCYIEVN